MRILVLTHTFPFPLDDGVKLHVYYLLKYLAQTNKIYLLSLSETEVELSIQEEIKKLGVTVVGVVTHKIPKSSWARLGNCLFDPVPFFVRQFESEKFRESISHFLNHEKIDLVQTDYLATTIYRETFGSLPAIAFPHDAMSMLFYRSAEKERNILKRWYLKIQSHKTLQFERSWLRKFEGLAFVSGFDIQYLHKHCPELSGIPTIIATGGVDMDYFHPMPGSEAENHTIVFRGVLSFFPNHDAAIYFYTTILRKIRKKIPNVRFVIAGKNPNPIWENYRRQDPNLIVTGFVPDIRTVMAQAHVVVCPMRAASGVQNKVLEAMAMAKAIVATPRACEALNLEDGKQIYLANDPETFAQKTIDLLLNKSARDALGQRARDYVLKHHQWQSNAIAFNQLYEEIKTTTQNKPKFQS